MKLNMMLVALAMLLAGCATLGTRSRTADYLAATDTRQLALACFVWANDHQGALPPNLEAVKDLATVKNVAAYELCLGGQIADIKNPATTVLVRERQTARCGCRAVAYADGHSELIPVPKP